MSTNYYLRENLFGRICRIGFKAKPDLHIGLSAAGWCFQLHVIPELGIRDLEDWVKLWYGFIYSIEDEYGRPVYPYEMVHIIAGRHGGKDHPGFTQEWFQRNYAVSGPNNLARAKVDGFYCVGHGSGTWDLIAGDFS